MTGLQSLTRIGQSVWLDSISRRLLDTGTLRRYAVEWGVSGLTSNPTIYDQAVRGGREYDADIRAGAAAVVVAGTGRAAAIPVREPQRAAAGATPSRSHSSVAGQKVGANRAWNSPKCPISATPSSSGRTRQRTVRRPGE